jgi:hypothetical protein
MIFLFYGTLGDRYILRFLIFDISAQCTIYTHFIVALTFELSSKKLDFHTFLKPHIF